MSRSINLQLRPYGNENMRALWRYHLALTYERAYPQRAEAEWQRYVRLARGDDRELQRLSEVEKNGRRKND